MKKYILSMHGDDLEKLYAAEIGIKVDAYELIWSAFIGNNGLNRMAPLRNFPSQKNDFRKNFSEHHYTIIQSILCLKIIKEDIVVFDRFQNDAILRIHNLIMGFYAHMGRIYDNLVQLFYCYGRIADIINKNLKLEEMAHENRFIKPHVKSLEEFYYQRHVVLHGKQVPIDFDKLGNIIFPKLRTEKNSRLGYDRTMLWDEAEEWDNLLYSIGEIETNLPICVNNILHSLFKKLKEEYLDENKIEIEFVTCDNLKQSQNEPMDAYNLQGKNFCGPGQGCSASLATLK